MADDPKTPTITPAAAPADPPPPAAPQAFIPGAEWQLLDRLAEPRGAMPELPW